MCISETLPLASEMRIWYNNALYPFAVQVVSAGFVSPVTWLANGTKEGFATASVKRTFNDEGKNNLRRPERGTVNAMTARKSTVGFARFACAACCILVAAAAVAMPTLPEIGFELILRQAVTNSPQSKVTSSEMKSFSVDEKDGRTSLVWRGHPLCGDGFTVTAELTPTPEKDGWDRRTPPSQSPRAPALSVRTTRADIISMPSTERFASPIFPRSTSAAIAMCSSAVRVRSASIRAWASRI